MQTLKLLRIAVAALALGWAGQSFAQTTTGQVVGVITDADTGKPIAGATVTARSPGWIDQSVTTDASGYYVITALPPMHYEVVAKAPGYAEAASRKMPVQIDWRIKNDMRLESARARATEPADAAPVASR